MCLLFVYRDPQHVQWVRAYVAVLDETRKYIMEYHTTGLVWNPKVCPTKIGSLNVAKTKDLC